MKAITIWQPWCTLIVEGLKPYEFRGDWITKEATRYVGQRIALQAGARPVQRSEVQELIMRLRDGASRRSTGLIKPEIAIPLLERVLVSPGCLPRSSVLCTAVLGEPIRNAELAAKLGLPWANDSDRDEHSNWGWPLTEIERLVPFVPASGMQGWWNWQPPADGA